MFDEKQEKSLKKANNPGHSTREDRIYNKHKKDKKDKKRSSTNSNRFNVAEAYKTIRTNLQFSLNKKKCNTIIITSTMPRDGKSTVTSNISVAFAQTGSRVLVIDCDMRNPRINKFFNILPMPGLSNLLVGLCSTDEAIQQTEYKNLSIITAGTIPPNPAELLNSTAMEDLLESLKTQFDLIVMDTPPINIVSDAVVVTKYSDGVILVVRHAVTTHPDIEKSIKSFEFANARILGIILNAVDYSKINGKHYGSYSRYKKYDSYGNYGSYGGYGGYGSYGASSDQIADLTPSSKESNSASFAAATADSGESVTPARVDS
ncbi:MAG: CpsD/CapB family tyrosine-protein kinase [Saccharofermentanales bacterium]